MKRILFVDDDEDVLEGLRLMLQPMQSAWEMCFAESGEQALSMMEEGLPFDIVVAAIQMQGIPGEELLSAVLKRYPKTVRFALSGASDTGASLRSSSLVHQFLTKPCDRDHLRSALARAFALREHLSGCRLKEKLLEMGSLPSMPALYLEVTEEIQSEDPSVARVGEIIEKDPGMSTKVLQIVNSAHMGLRSRVTNIVQAASLLGLNNLRTFVLLAEVFAAFEEDKVSRKISLDNLWNHGLIVGNYSKIIARHETEDKKIVDDSYTAGLLHDVGLLILATRLPEELDEAIGQAKETKVSLFEAEKELFGGTHAEVGGYLLELWGLPDPVVEAITFHDYPSAWPEDRVTHTTEYGFTALTAVHAANYFCGDKDVLKDTEAVTEVDTFHLDRLGLTERLETWWDLCEGLAKTSS